MNSYLEYIKENLQKSGREREEHYKKFSTYMRDLDQDITDKKEKKYAEIDEEYQAKRRKQEILAMNLSRLSPASSLTFAAMNLGKTGIHEHERFFNSIRIYKQVFSNWTKEKSREISEIMRADRSKIRPKPDLSDMPRYEFSPESLRDSFARALPDFMIMILFIILFSIGAYVSFLKYDVR